MRTLAALWVGGLIAVSLQPLRPAATAWSHQLHRPFHLVVFAATALVLGRFFAVAEPSALPLEVLPAKAGIKAIFATILLAGFIEMLQHLIYQHQMEWWDVRDDAASAIAAILLAHAASAALAIRENL